MQRSISASRTAALLGDAAQRSPAYASIAAELRLLISDGRIPPGTRLPSERELTLALGVSRTTVTRAYSHLKDLGYLTSRQGSGSVAALPTSVDSHDLLLDPGPAGSDRINLTCAAPKAPPGVAAAYAYALDELPGHLQELGYFPSGLPALRAAIARRYDARGLPTDPDQILVTSGALAALAVVTRAFVDTGDRVLMESPTYPNAVANLRATGARVSGADIDQSGWATASLVDSVRQLRPSLAYLMPDFHNPTGLLMDDEERARLASALRTARTLPVVDETMVEMAVDDVVMPQPFGVHAADTIALGSASKSFWGGLRIGWVRAPHARMTELAAARLSLDLGAPVVEQLALTYLLDNIDEVLTHRRAQLAASRAALVSALTATLPSWGFRLPQGGLSLWCELPRPLSSTLASTGLRHGVQLAAGPLFAPEGGLERFVRIPYTLPPEMLGEAVNRIAAAWDEVARAPRTRRGRASDEQAMVT